MEARADNGRGPLKSLGFKDLLDYYGGAWRLACDITAEILPKARLDSPLGDNVALAIFNDLLKLGPTKLREASTARPSEPRRLRELKADYAVLEVYEGSKVAVRPKGQVKRDDPAVTRFLEDRVLKGLAEKYGARFNLYVRDGLLEKVELSGAPCDEAHLKELLRAADWAFKKAANRGDR